MFSSEVHLSDSALEWRDLVWNRLEALVMVHHYDKIMFKTRFQ